MACGVFVVRALRAWGGRGRTKRRGDLVLQILYPRCERRSGERDCLCERNPKI